MHPRNIFEVGFDVFGFNRLKLLCIYDVTQAAIAKIEWACFVLIEQITHEGDEYDVSYVDARPLRHSLCGIIEGNFVRMVDFFKID